MALKVIWKTKKISKKTKIYAFSRAVYKLQSVLLYAAESWKVTKGICHRLEVFQNKCLRSILHIRKSVIRSNIHIEVNEFNSIWIVFGNDSRRFGFSTRIHVTKTSG